MFVAYKNCYANSKNHLKIRNKMKKIREQYPLVFSRVEKIILNNGRPYLVGGAVRDLVMNLPIKDMDIEVHGLSEHQLEKILEECGFVSTVGKSFGVFRLHGLDVDWS